MDESRSGILDGDRKVAAIGALGIPAHAQAAAEAEGQPTGGIEPWKRREVADHVLENDLAAGYGAKHDPTRQLDPDHPTRLPADDRAANHRARAYPGHGTVGRSRAVGPDRGDPVTLGGDDQAIEIDGRFDLHGDFLVTLFGRGGGCRRVAQTALRAGAGRP